jgi:pyridine nucleotide-disulfide oxidoreductase
LPIVALLRSRTMPETRGFMKALVEADGDRILGFTMLGAEAAKVMAVAHTRWWRLCPTRAYATRLSRTREWQRASAQSSRMYWPDRARQDIVTTVTSSGTPTLTERQAMHCAGAPLGPEWVTSSGFDNVRLGQVSLTQQTYRRYSLGAARCHEADDGRRQRFATQASRMSKPACTRRGYLARISSLQRRSTEPTQHDQRRS